MLMEQNKQLKIIIKTHEDLGCLLVWHGIRGLPSHSKISLQIPALTANMNDFWEKQLNKVFFDCGCNMGAAFGIIAMVMYFIYFIYYDSTPNTFKVSNVLTTGAYFFLGGFVGKRVGLCVSKYRLNKIINELFKITYII